MHWIKTAYALLASVPFLSFFLVWAIAYLFSRDKKLAIGWSIHATALLLLGSVSEMLDTDRGAGGSFWFILLFFLLLAGLLGNLQNRKRGRVDPKRLLNAVGRIGFFLLSCGYVVLLCVGISRYFFNT